MFKIFMLLLLLLTSTTSYAAQKIRLGVEAINYFPLYGTFDASDNNAGEYVGLSADIFRLYNKSQSDFEITFEPRPIKRLFSEFLSDDSTLDAKFPDNPYWAADLKKGIKVVYSDSVIDYTDGLFLLKENKDMPVTKIKSMGILGGFTPFDYLDQIKSGQIKVQDSLNTSSLLEKLVQKRVETVYINKFIGNCKISKVHADDTVMFGDALPHTDSHYFLSTVKFPKLITSFNTFYKSHKSEIEKMTQEYVEKKCK